MLETMRKLEALRQEMDNLARSLPPEISGLDNLLNDLHRVRGRFMTISPWDQQSWQYDWHENVQVTIENKEACEEVW